MPPSIAPPDRVSTGCLTQCWHIVIRLTSKYTFRKLCARILTVIICLIFILIPSVAVLGGQYVFLALSLKELVFPIQQSFAEQLEVTILNCLGALTGVGISSLAIYFRALADRHGPSDHGVSSLVPALFLALISCLGQHFRLLDTTSCSLLAILSAILLQPVTCGVVYRGCNWQLESRVSYPSGCWSVTAAALQSITFPSELRALAY